MKTLIPRIFMLIIVLHFVVHAIAQPEIKDSTQAYQYWGQRGIIEVVFSSMQDYAQNNHIKPPEESGMNSFEERYVQKINEKSLNEIDDLYKEIFEFLYINGWKLTAEKIAKPLMEKYDKGLALDSTFFYIIDLPGSKYKETASDIINNINESLVKLKRRAPGNVIADVVRTETSEFPQVEKKMTNFIPIFISFFLGILLGGMLAFFYVRNKVYQILKKERHSYEEILKEEYNEHSFFLFFDLIKILKKRKDDYKNPTEAPGFIVQDNNLKSENENLKKQVSELKKAIDSLNVDLKNIHEEINFKSHREPEKSESSSLKKNLYYSIPEKDGSFKMEEAREHKELDSFYKLEFTSNTEGHIFFISGDYDLRAIENIDYYINPVCEVQNIGNRVSARKVQMVNPGNFIKNGNFLLIIDKIKIKLV